LQYVLYRFKILVTSNQPSILFVRLLFQLIYNYIVSPTVFGVYFKELKDGCKTILLDIKT